MFGVAPALRRTASESRPKRVHRHRSDVSGFTDSPVSHDRDGNGRLLLQPVDSTLKTDGIAATVMPFRPRDRPPGERFHYASAETQVLGLILRAATGKPLAEYLSEKIWQPMGAVADASWVIDKDGYEVALAGFKATVRDYARLGMLLANDGALDGRQIPPSAQPIATGSIAPIDLP